MLDGLRDFAKSWPGKILGAFLLVGVAGFGINNVIIDLGSNTVARVGNEEISAREFLRAYQSQVSAITTQLGSVPTTSQAESMGLPTAVLLRLSEGAALDGLANQFGLGVSDAKLGQMLREDPSFHGTLGTFEPAIFSQTLQRAGWTEAEYFAARGSEARREQLADTLFAGATLPAIANDLINDYATATRTIDYIALNETNIETPAEPGEAELAAYLADHQSEYRTVETRKVKLLDLSLASLAATKSFDESAISAEYERIKDNLTTPERRTIEQVALNTPERQALFEQGLAAGDDFGALIAQAGVTPSSLGTLARAQVTDTRLADAAFALDEGAFAIIDGIGGKRAVHVAEIEAEGQPSLDEVRAEVIERLGTASARNEISDVLDQIEELRAAFQPIEAIAGRFGLTVHEADVTVSGAELSVLPNLAPADYPRVAQAIFQAQDGQLIPSVALGGNAHVWFDLEAVEPARDQTLAEVRDEVTAAINEQRANEALLALGAQIVTRLENGEALADIALELNLFPQISTPFTRFGSEDGTIDSTLAAAAFAGGPDHKGSTVTETGEFIVFEVVDISEPDEPLAAQALASINNEARTGLYSEFVSALRDDAGLRVNQQTLTQLLIQNFGE
ncbi:SurA N-terminal domain-containing protein [Devosia sp. YIM 151766]|uniref:peptidylprolyl isomerase n=1 Tax=Devosia sp. YIM 151766 TaxID=3017325 RepID=UPI00255D089B|nr:peptidylprolyl isomerase [Devosia sp. YIM 151766]WIY54313.1 SurA N-terminal domain-containing protein [Devosia sp. YIM 151766]